jgi:hypothetical protein
MNGEDCEFLDGARENESWEVRFQMIKDLLGS